MWPLARLLYERGPWPVQRNAAARSNASSGAARDYVAKRTRLPRAMPAQGQQNWPTENTGGGSCQGSSRSASGRLDRHAHANWPTEKAGGYRHLPTKVGASARQPGPSKCLRPNSCARPTENTGGGSCQGSSRSASGKLDGHAHATGGGSCQGSSRSASGKCDQKFWPRRRERSATHHSPSPGAALCKQRRAAIQ